MLMLESKELDKHVDSTKECFDECIIDLESRHKNLEAGRDSMVERSIELDTVRESLQSQMKDLECREANFFSLQEAKLEEFKVKEGQLAEIRTWVVGNMQEVELKEEMLNAQKESMEVLLESFRMEKQEFKDIQKNVTENFNKISLKERQIEDRSNELKICQDSMERQAKELYLKEEKVEMRDKELNNTLKLIEERCQELDNIAEELDCARRLVEERSERLDSKEKQLNSVQIEDRSNELKICQDSMERQAKELYLKEEKVEMRDKELNNTLKLIEERCQELDNIAEELDCARRLVEERSERLDSKEKQLNSVQKYVQDSFNDFHAKNKQLKCVEELLEKRLKDQSNMFNRKEKLLEDKFNKWESKQKQLEERCRELESREMQINEQSKEIVLEGNELDNVVDFHVQIGQLEDTKTLNLPSVIDGLDGRSLQFYLNEKFKDDESSASEVCQILGSISNPPKLVLDAMEGFYPPHMMKEDVEFKTSVVRSCVLLLKQLLKLSPRIGPHVKRRALKLAGQWKLKMVVYPRNSLEVLAFILFLAVYNLVSNFDCDEVLQLLKFVKRDEVPELCSSLGLQEKVPDFIRRLVEKRLHLEAIEYVLAFNIEDTFPPATLLDGYISYEEETAGKILEEGLYRVEAREYACRRELNALKAVMSFIMLHELEYQNPTEKMELRIAQLESRRIHLQRLASYFYPELQERFESHTEERELKKHKGLSPEHSQRPFNVSILGSPPYLTAQRRENYLPFPSYVSPHMNQYPPGIFGCDNFASYNHDVRSFPRLEMNYQPLY